MTKMNEQLSADEAKAFAAKVGKLADEVEVEKLCGDSKYDWRVARVGDVGSATWNDQMQEIDLELEKLKAKHASNAKAKELQRIKQLAGIAKPQIDALALKQAKRQTKKL